MTNILEVNAIQTFINQFHILEGVSLTVPEGSITALLGRNGAGKTTTLRSIMGLTPPREGQIIFAGEEIQGKAAYDIAARGIGYVPEYRAIFRALTVEENLRIAERSKGDLARRGDLIFELFPDLKRFYHLPGGQLSGGQQQMLAIARALVPENRLLLVDEPSEGLAPIIIDAIVAALRHLAAHSDRAAGGAELPHGLTACRPLLHRGRRPDGRLGPDGRPGQRPAVDHQVPWGGLRWGGSLTHPPRSELMLSTLRRNRPLLITLIVVLAVLLLMARRYEPKVTASILLSGLTLGSLYFLVASGLSLIFGLMDVLNFAQGGIFMIGAYLGFTTYANPRLILNILPFALAILGGAQVGRWLGGLLPAWFKKRWLDTVFLILLTLLSLVLLLIGFRGFDLGALAAATATATGGAVATELAQDPAAVYLPRVALLTASGLLLGIGLSRVGKVQMRQRTRGTTADRRSCSDRGGLCACAFPYPG